MILNAGLAFALWLFLFFALLKRVTRVTHSCWSLQKEGQGATHSCHSSQKEQQEQLAHLHFTKRVTRATR
jgi:hypothetical protein